jgi:single-strand DNA-binding protein
MKKGNTILVSGAIQVRTWQDNQGQKRYATEIVADEVVALGGGRDNGVNAKDPIVSVPNQGSKNYVPDAYGGMPSGFEAIEIPNDESLPFD